MHSEGNFAYGTIFCPACMRKGTGGHVIIIRSFHLLILIFSDKFDVRSVIG